MEGLGGQAMQLRKRFLNNNDKDQNEPVMEPQEIYIDEQPDQCAADEGEQPSLIEPRRVRHSKGKKMTTVFIFVSFVSVILFVGWGAGWMKREQTRTTTTVNAPLKVEAQSTPKAVEKVVPQPIESKPAVQPQTPAPTQVTQPKVKEKQELRKPVFKQIMKHKVEPGETLYRISIKYYHTGNYANYLTQYNGLRSPSDLVSGTYIKVPYPPK